MKTRKKDERYYRSLLGVSPDATRKEIRQAYLNCVKYYHPDNYEIGSLSWENANKRIKEFNEAYAYLKSGPRMPPPQPPREHTHDKRTHQTRKKRPTNVPPFSADKFQEIFQAFQEEERDVTGKFIRLAHAVLNKYLVLLTERSTIVFGAKLLAFLLILAVLLAAMGVTTDRIAARLACVKKLLYFIA